MDLIWSKVLQVYVRCPKGSRALTLLRGIGRFRRLCGPPEGGYFRNFWVGCAAGTLEPLTYTRVSSAEFCYPILE